MWLCVVPVGRFFSHREYPHSAVSLSSTEACPVQPMQRPSAGCGWHCVCLPAAPQCSSRRWVPECSRGGEVSPTAAPRPGTPLPLCFLLHTVEKTSYHKCSKFTAQVRGRKFRQDFLHICNMTFSTHEVKCLFWKIRVHIPERLVLFVLRADIDDNRVNPLS